MAETEGLCENRLSGPEGRFCTAPFQEEQEL